MRHTPRMLHQLIEEKVRCETFFERATLLPNADQKKGLICSYRIEDLQHPITKKARCVDKLVHALAQGQKMENKLRQQ